MSSLIVIAILAAMVWWRVKFMDKLTNKENPLSKGKIVLMVIPFILGIVALVWLDSIGYVPGWFKTIMNVIYILS